MNKLSTTPPLYEWDCQCVNRLSTGSISINIAHNSFGISGGPAADAVLAKVTLQFGRVQAIWNMP
jgi:hypothetical protein